MNSPVLPKTGTKGRPGRPKKAVKAPPAATLPARPPAPAAKAAAPAAAPAPTAGPPAGRPTPRGGPSILRDRFGWLATVGALALGSGLVILDVTLTAVIGLGLALVGILLTQGPLWYRPGVRVMLFSLGFMGPALVYYGYHLATFRPLI